MTDTEFDNLMSDPWYLLEFDLKLIRVRIEYLRKQISSPMYGPEIPDADEGEF